MAVLSKILPFLKNAIPSALAVKALGKLDSRFTRFFGDAAAAGFGTDQVISYLRNTLGGEEKEEQRLSEQSRQRTLTPDEEYNLQEMQRSQSIPNTLQTGVSLATGLGAGLSSLEKTPQAQHEKTEQTDPRVASVRKAADAIQSRKTSTKVQDVAQNMKSTVPITDIASFLESVFPQLSTALERMILAGKSPEDAAFTTMSFPSFKKPIQEITKESGMSWPSIVRNMYGPSSQQQPQQRNAPSSAQQSMPSSQQGLGEILKMFTQMRSK
jgi:hypothetical protein